MTHSLRWLLVLSVSVVACGAMTGLYAQDDLEALLQDLGGQKKPAADAAKKAAPAEKPAEAAPAPAEKPAEAAPAPAEKPAEAAPAPAAEEACRPLPLRPPKSLPKPLPLRRLWPLRSLPGGPAAVAEKPAEAAPAPPAAVEKPAEALPLPPQPPKPLATRAAWFPNC